MTNMMIINASRGSIQKLNFQLSTWRWPMKRAETCSWSLCNKLYISLPPYSCVRQVYTHPNSVVLFSHRVPSDANLLLTGPSLYKSGCTPLEFAKHHTQTCWSSKPATPNRIHMLLLLYRCGWTQLIFRYVCLGRCFVQCYRANCLIKVLVLWSWQRRFLRLCVHNTIHTVHV